MITVRRYFLRTELNSVPATVNFASIASFKQSSGVEQAVGQKGECPSRFRCKGARIRLYPTIFQWLHSLWSDWNSVETIESVCWSTQCLQIL